MTTAFLSHLRQRLDEVRAAGLLKDERVLQTPQRARVAVAGRELLNLCANNYLGLSDHPAIVAAAQAALERWGFGLSSVRFICGTQEIHRELERRIAAFLGVDDAILFSSCFDANTGLFEAVLDEQDAVISDQLNHASIIDGIRLCKARRLRYANRDLADLERQLQAAADARFRLIASDGVFSMDGGVADVAGLLALARRHDAALMIDDSHAVGFLGAGGRGTPELCGVHGRVDILTGTLGKALGGASGGYVAGRREVVELLRQRARPYLFSNSVAPAIVAAALAALDLVESSSELRERLMANAGFFRERMRALGFDLPAGGHPIVPVMLGDARLAVRMAQRLLADGIYVVAFSYPVVPQGAARIRVQVSAAHAREDLAWAAERFAAARDALRDRGPGEG